MSKKTWQRGKRKLTPQEKIIADERQKNRVKVANLVARSENIDKTCCICGKPGRILHNTRDPYFISFICRECLKEPGNRAIAVKNRKDIRRLLDRKGLASKNFTDSDTIKLVEGYPKDISFLGDYCDKHNLTRYQFSKLIDRYCELKQSKEIYNVIKNHSRHMQQRDQRAINGKNNIYSKM